jgi:hypothetical protein
MFLGLQSKYWKELYRHFRNFHYEVDDDGDLLIAHARIGGVFELESPDGLGVTRERNLITTEGANYLLSAGVGNGAQSTTFYIAPFSGAVTVLDTWTAATFASSASELTTQYTEASRIEYVESVPASKATNNNSNPAVMTSAVDSVVVRGAGVLSASTKGGTTGVLLAAARYGSDRSLPTTGDTLAIRYQVTLSNV